MSVFKAMLAPMLAVAAGSTAFTVQAGQGVTNFSNPAAVGIPDSGPGNPFPSVVTVAGLRGNVYDLRVTLNGAYHTWIGDLDVALVAPDGRQVPLMARAGGSRDLSDTTITFRTDATALLATAGSPIASGSYQTAAGAPNNLTLFNGTASYANGDWKLYVFDGEAGDSGQIARGWTLSFTSDVFTTCAAEGYSGTRLMLCQKACESNLTGSALTGVIKMYVLAFKEQPACAL
ncbi:proprotein convertase P-domain-containing protein [Lysobacter xanthus]